MDSDLQVKIAEGRKKKRTWRIRTRTWVRNCSCRNFGIGPCVEQPLMMAIQKITFSIGGPSVTKEVGFLRASRCDVESSRLRKYSPNPLSIKAHLHRLLNLSPGECASASSERRETAIARGTVPVRTCRAVTRDMPRICSDDVSTRIYRSRADVWKRYTRTDGIWLLARQYYTTSETSHLHPVNIQ